VRSVQINGIEVDEGEVIGIVNGKLQVTGNSPASVAIEALTKMDLEDYEIITIYYGETIDAITAEELATAIKEKWTEQEVEVVDGGQPHYHYILSAE
jgi:dihydroxyacetone kinase-like predicted kinase